MKHLERLKKMVTLAAKMEWMAKDPFERYQLKFQKMEREFLTEEELALLENTLLPKNKLNRARDLFIFSCYTGLSYIDLVNLTSSIICIGVDGEYWIKTARQKTEIPVNVPPLPQAFRLIEKYRHDPVVANQRRPLPALFIQSKTKCILKGNSNHF